MKNITLDFSLIAAEQNVLVYDKSLLKIKGKKAAD